MGPWNCGLDLGWKKEKNNGRARFRMDRLHASRKVDLSGKVVNWNLYVVVGLTVHLAQCRVINIHEG